MCGYTNFRFWHTFVPLFFRADTSLCQLFLAFGTVLYQLFSHRFYLVYFFLEVILSLKRHLNSLSFLEKTTECFIKTVFFYCHKLVTANQKDCHKTVPKRIFRASNETPGSARAGNEIASTFSLCSFSTFCLVHEIFGLI